MDAISALTDAVSRIYELQQFLTAARRPRYLEVREVLDAAERSTKVYFAAARAPLGSTRMRFNDR